MNSAEQVAVAERIVAGGSLAAATLLPIGDVATATSLHRLSPLPVPITEPIGTPDFKLVSIGQDSADHEHSEQIVLKPAMGSAELPTFPEREPPPPPTPWYRKDVVSVLKMDVVALARAFRQAVRPLQPIKVSVVELTALIAGSDAGVAEFTFARMPLARGSESAGFVVLGGTVGSQQLVLDDLVRQAEAAGHEVTVVDSGKSSAQIEEMLLNCMARDIRNDRLSWFVISAIDTRGRIAALRRVVDFAWTRGVALAFSVGDWGRFEATYGSLDAALLINKRQHKLILQATDGRAARWAGDLLNGITHTAVCSLGPRGGLFRHAGDYPCVDVNLEPLTSDFARAEAA